MGEDTIASGSAERAAIERWEHEGGRVPEQEQGISEGTKGGAVVSVVEQVEDVILGLKPTSSLDEAPAE